jgi:GH25 family lysozyme M1 (1,4-beta-N-acetylmuramidase)
MTSTQFVDISNYNTVTSWTDYRNWSSRIALKSSEGTSYIDPTFATNRANAKAAGVTDIWHYHFARPDLNNDPVKEAQFQARTVGEIGANDLVILDLEVNDARATAEWAYQFLAQQERSYPGQVGIYASSAYIQQRLQSDSRLSQYHLWLANWTYNPASRPACPLPWKNYIALQYTDRATGIPGIAGSVDADVFLGESSMTIPTGWTDDGTTLKAPNGIAVVRGFRDYVLAHNWDANNWPLQAEQGRTPLELSNPSLGGGTAQDFRYTTLEWTSSKGVFVAWTGVELQALRAALLAATTASTTPDNSAIITALNIASTTITTLTTDLTAAGAAIQQALSNLKS